MPSSTPLECATEIVAALDRMRAAEQDALDALKSLWEREDWPSRFFAATQGTALQVDGWLKGTSGSEYDFETLYRDAVELRELLEIATLEESLVEVGDDA
jgi:hypothetical protein